MNWSKTLFMAVVYGIVCTACAIPHGELGAIENIDSGKRPELHTDEAGLWMVLDNMEEKLKTSGNRITDPHINQYVREIVCKLAGPDCASIRIYVMQVPLFNATMAPNGIMQIWTGLLLRAKNEAQLAYVLGHEIGPVSYTHLTLPTKA